METININKAGPNRLSDIIHIGAVRAYEIIRNRPFKDVHELSKIPGLGGKRMKDIIEQGLVTV